MHTQEKAEPGTDAKKEAAAVTRPAAMSIPQAARYLGISVSMVWKLNRENEDFQRLVTLFNIGTRKLAPTQGLDAFAALQIERAATEQEATRTRRARAHRAK
jgi:hypothetical protein